MKFLFFLILIIKFFKSGLKLESVTAFVKSKFEKSICIYNQLSIIFLNSFEKNSFIGFSLLNNFDISKKS